LVCEQFVLGCGSQLFFAAPELLDEVPQGLLAFEVAESILLLLEPIKIGVMDAAAEGCTAKDRLVPGPFESEGVVFAFHDGLESGHYGLIGSGKAACHFVASSLEVSRCFARATVTTCAPLVKDVLGGTIGA